MADSPFQQVIRILDTFGEKVVTELQGNLAKRTKTKGAGLGDTIKFTTKVMGGVYVFELSLDYYYKFLDKGVRGTGHFEKGQSNTTMVGQGSPYQFKGKNLPKGVISKWFKGVVINRQRIGGTGAVNSKKGIKRTKNIIKQKQLLSFLVGRSIASRGLRATKFYSDVINPSLIKQLESDLAVATGKAVQIELESFKP
jgi:hypothetical protein